MLAETCWGCVRTHFPLSPFSVVDSASLEIVGIYSSVGMDAGEPHSRWMDVWPLKSGRKSIGSVVERTKDK